MEKIIDYFRKKLHFRCLTGLILNDQFAKMNFILIRNIISNIILKLNLLVIVGIFSFGFQVFHTLLIGSSNFS